MICQNLPKDIYFAAFSKFPNSQFSKFQNNKGQAVNLRLNNSLHGNNSENRAAITAH
jgi:hypothetical protein